MAGSVTRAENSISRCLKKEGSRAASVARLAAFLSWGARAEGQTEATADKPKLRACSDSQEECSRCAEEERSI